MDKPRFLFVQEHHFLKATGGAETQCWLLATELARRGWDVHYASEMNTVPEPNPLEGVTLHGLPENPSQWKGNRVPLRRLLNELQPDVVLNQVVNLYTAYSMLDSPPQTFKIYLGAADFDGLMWTFLWQLGKTTSWLGYLRHLPVNVHIRRTALDGLRRADLVLAQHKQQQEQFADVEIKSVLFRNVHPAVSKSEIQRHEGMPVVLWVGSLKQWKRPELFVDLARRCRDLPARFVIVGAIAHPSYHGLIAEATRTLENFEFRGFVPYGKVGEQFAQAHVFVSTSVSEGFANTFIQSWIRGVPVASLGVDPENILRDKGLGFCAENMDQLERGVRELIGDPARRREIGSKARDFAVAEFDLVTVVDKLEGLLRERGARTRDG